MKDQESDDKSFTGPVPDFSGVKYMMTLVCLTPRNEILCLKAQLYDCEQQ